MSLAEITREFERDPIKKKSEQKVLVLGFLSQRENEFINSFFTQGVALVKKRALNLELSLRSSHGQESVFKKPCFFFRRKPSNDKQF